jgi:hypothetical protein
MGSLFCSFVSHTRLRKLALLRCHGDPLKKRILPHHGSPPLLFLPRHAAFPGIGIAEEEPVFLSKRGGTNGVLDEIIADFDSTVFEKNAKQRPVGERVVDGLPHGAARQITAGLFKDDQSAMQALADWRLWLVRTAARF